MNGNHGYIFSWKKTYIYIIYIWAVMRSRFWSKFIHTLQADSRYSTRRKCIPRPKVHAVFFEPFICAHVFCNMSPYEEVTYIYVFRFFCFFFSARFFGFIFLLAKFGPPTYWDKIFSAQKQKKTLPHASPRKGCEQHVTKVSGSCFSKKRRGQLGLSVDNAQKFGNCLVITEFQYRIDVWRLLLILLNIEQIYAGQTFDFLHENLCRHALE